MAMRNGAVILSLRIVSNIILVLYLKENWSAQQQRARKRQRLIEEQSDPTTRKSLGLDAKFILTQSTGEALLYMTVILGDEGFSLHSRNWPFFLTLS